jgi:hypothetical protein
MMHGQVLACRSAGWYVGVCASRVWVFVTCITKNMQAGMQAGWVRVCVYCDVAEGDAQVVEFNP